MKKKGLCVFLFDRSGSMRGENRIEALNSALRKFIRKVRSNRILRNNLYISINTFDEDVYFRAPVIGYKVRYERLELGPGTNIENAIFETIEKIDEWKRQLAEKLNPNFVYLILVTDDQSISNSDENKWIESIQNLTRRESLRFRGLGVDNADLSILEEEGNPNIIISSNLNFEDYFKDLVKDIRENLPPPWYKRVWKWLKALGRRIDRLLTITFTWFGITGISFTGIGIKFISFSLIGGFTLLGITIVKNVNYYTTKKEVRTIQIVSDEEVSRHLEELKTYKEFNNKTTIETQIKLNRGEGISNLFFPNEDLEIRYTFIDSLENYILGAYSISSSPEIENAANLFVYLFDKYIYTEFTTLNKLELSIIGVTDAAPVRNTLVYKGEYGDLQNQSYYIQDSLTSIALLKKDDPIKNNETLGFLRAYSFGDFLRRKLDILIEKETTYSKFTETNDANHGGKYRKVVVVIRMNNVIEK